jgi:hypothetical protein
MTSRPLIVNTGFDKAEGMEILRSGYADAIDPLARSISPPDLVSGGFQVYVRSRTRAGQDFATIFS